MALPSGRILRFGGLQALNAIAPILVLPAVIAAVGAEGWVGFSIGYGVGAAASVGLNFAWPITGPARVAGQPLAVAHEVFRLSLMMRLLVSLPCLAVGGLVVVALCPPGHRWLGLMMMVATASNGLAANWYFIGRGEAGGIVAYETFPRLAATVLSVPLIHLTQRAWLYPALLLLVGIMSSLVASWRITGDIRPRPPTNGGVLAATRRQAPVAGAGLLSSLATALAVPLAALVNPAISSLALFAAGTRLRALAQAGVGALAAGAQGWVSEGTSAELVHRGRLCLRMCAVAGLLTAAGLVALSPVIDTLIFGPEIEVNLAFATVVGLTCFAYSLSLSLTSHILAPAHASREIVSATMTGSIVAAPVIVVGMAAFGAVGAMLGVLVAETLVAVLQWRSARLKVWASSSPARVVPQ